MFYSKHNKQFIFIIYYKHRIYLQSNHFMHLVSKIKEVLGF